MTKKILTKQLGQSLIVIIRKGLWNSRIELSDLCSFSVMRMALLGNFTSWNWGTTNSFFWNYDKSVGAKRCLEVYWTCAYKEPTYHNAKCGVGITLAVVTVEIRGPVSLAAQIKVAMEAFPRNWRRGGYASTGHRSSANASPWPYPQCDCELRHGHHSNAKTSSKEDFKTWTAITKLGCLHNRGWYKY